ncbi:cytochrome c [Herbaspirillum sp.]|uniref:c-type cytochrome n=1 Tax=Herbaspirillum sp. TaxID=1890675 RepID=UPI0025B89F0A|nr:cytochrome c [Herbaspirillum sp.]
MPDIGIDWDACIDLMLRAMQLFQQALLQLLSILRIAADVDGQPAWPFALRLSGEVMLVDHGVARALLAALGCTAAALLLALVAMLWKRMRVPLLASAALLALFTPWPQAGLITTSATPTTFHNSPTGFSAEAIVRGERLYRQQCIGCHGADGKGNTPLALSLPVAPPNLSSGLLWRRFDGDIYWSLRHGKGSMPAFGERIGIADNWALIDYMKANAAGVGIADTGAWPRPVALPDLALACRRSGATRTGRWRGQRVRLVVGSGGTGNGEDARNEDPRLQSVLLGGATGNAVGAIDCVGADADGLRAIAIITGTPPAKLAGAELLADRDGWLRARSSGGAWSQSDMLCRSPLAVGLGAAGAKREGIDQLIAAMDADPVHFVKGGFVH